MLSEISALLFVMDLLAVEVLLLHAWGAVELSPQLMLPPLTLLLLRAWGAVGRLHVHTTPHVQELLTALLCQQGPLV
jgi:hypothetical protein